MVVRAGLGAAPARKPPRARVHHAACVLYLAAGLLFRFAWVGAGRASARDDRAVAEMARDRGTGT